MLLCAGDYYYGSREPQGGSGHFDESSLIGMYTEALNIADRDAYNDAAAVAASAAAFAGESVQAVAEGGRHKGGSGEVRRNSSDSKDASVPGTPCSSSSAGSTAASSFSSSSSTDAVGTTVLSGKDWGRGHVVIAIGPERGWTEKEIEMLGRNGYVTASMGARTLSSPTAVVSAVAIAQEALR
jgi:hypothetical protein